MGASGDVGKRIYASVEEHRLRVICAQEFQWWVFPPQLELLRDTPEMKISLYKGGLHKIIGIPRRWAIPKPSINLPLFKKALEKRAEALQLTAKDNSAVVEPAAACFSFPGKSAVENESEGKPQAVLECKEDASESLRKRKRLHAKGSDEGAPAKHVCIEKPAAEDLTRADAAKSSERLSNSQQAQAAEAAAEQQEMAIDKNPQTVFDVEHNENKLSAESKKPMSEEQAKRKAELEDKLQTLTSEKHRLVQLLKQILSSEEESKRRGQGSLQSPPTAAPPAPITAPPPCMIPKPAVSDPPPAAPAAPLLAAAAEMGVRPMDLEEGELDYARTPSPQPRMLLAAGHGNHSLGSRQTQLSSQGGMSRLGYHSSSSNNSSSGGGYTHSSSHAKGGRIVKWES